MKLPGKIEERLGVLHRERFQSLPRGGVVDLADEKVRVQVSLGDTTNAVLLRLKPSDIQFLREGASADFVILFPKGDDTMEAHVIEHKTSVGENEWAHIQKQLEWSVVRLLAIAGVLGFRIEGVTTYTAFCNDKLGRETSANPVGMKVPVGPEEAREGGEGRRRWLEARLSWERDHFRMDLFGHDVEHRRIRAGVDELTMVTPRARLSPDGHETHWLLHPYQE